MTSVATRYTTEGGLIGAVGRVRMAADWTVARGVTGIDQHDRNTDPLCFVADKGTELGERPAMQVRTLLPSSPHPRANALEVFKADRPLCAFGSRNNPFADRVVYVLCEAALLTGKQLQPPPCRFGAELLQVGSQPPMPMPHTVDHPAAVDGSIRVAGNVGHTQVNPKDVVNVLWVGFLNLARYQQIPVATVEQQVAFALPGGKHPALALTTHKGDGLPAPQSPDRKRRVRQGEREDAVIVGDGSVWAKGAPGLRVELVGVAHFSECAHDHLRRQAKHLTHILIAQLLKRKLAKGARLPGYAADVVARFIRLLQRAPQSVCLLRCWLQLELCGKFHILKYNTQERLMQSERSAAFLRAPEGGGFLPLFREY